MNKYDNQFTDEELEQQQEEFHNTVENWDSSLSSGYQSIEEFEKDHKVVAKERHDLSLIFLRKRQEGEIINLQYENAESDKISKLEKVHKKELDALYKKKYKSSSITADEMERIQVKPSISVKEYTLIYGDSATTQKNDRNKINKPLPYHQKVEGGNVYYIAEEVKQWRDETRYK